MIKQKQYICQMAIVLLTKICSLTAEKLSFFTSLAIAEYGILGDLLAFITQSPADFHDTQRNN